MSHAANDRLDDLRRDFIDELADSIILTSYFNSCPRTKTKATHLLQEKRRRERQEKPSIDIEAILAVADELAATCSGSWHRRILSQHEDMIGNQPYTGKFGCYCSMAGELRKAVGREETPRG